MSVKARIIGLGSYLPKRVLSNQDLRRWLRHLMSGSSRAQA